jgi:hypothetical protein
VLLELINELLPRLAEHIADLGVDLPAVTFAWFLSLYTDCLPVEVSAMPAARPHLPSPDLFASADAVPSLGRALR